MRKLKVVIIGDGSYENPYRGDYTPKEGETVYHFIEVDKTTGKPLSTECEIIVKRRGKS